MKKIIILLISITTLIAYIFIEYRGKSDSTIDSTLQVKVTSILESKLTELNALSGQAIIMEVQTGHIKAMVGLERKDSANYLPCENFSQVHESALIHPISILAALETGKVKLADTVDVGDGIYICKGDTIKDYNWHRGGYGEISIKQGLASSSNIAVYKTMEKAFGDDAQAYFNLLNNMSYGKPDSIAGIANLKPAYFVTPKDSGWSDTAFAWLCIGYNQTITPIQMLTFYNAIANSGKMVQPQLYKNSTTVINPQIASQANIDSLKQALEYVVTDGLGQPAKSDKTQVAGETETIQLEDGSYIVEFCGYFPANAPQYSIIVSIHKEGLPASGGLMAGNVFRRIAEYISTNNKYFNSK
ncbi:penicillin-binding transpeptidase domain-containing protein [Coprobacter fastidiosus]|uniref:Cell division protein FtsI (Penicillin-binding protein 3) n=1 Tax=Coprobacter fastidiosus NSB1 = JCM 33896 TaxID=1349822 RepID=A0A495VN89_9BACT|nr:penicillin-binding transpeptidase domain-containing protein [Coprobacter fastidiosus]ERM88943.1 penicillin-binding protein 2B [Coprobacter fastidiosus NSB1 = JCM 33896]RKT50871.1 cell division protein FtsI (penicillin-binding protein 3) [Coprobacter fastidiosus NSB1 = JCM 33896]BEG63491.1 penicillin-binding transpeptidase domain-containing protein [Coprobacter fastidiosus]